MVRAHLLAAGLWLLAGSCGTGGGNAPPRVSAIPEQLTPGGTVFSLDLDPFVTDREGTPITFAVLSGGGSFAGSVFSHTFDTLGSYTVQFRATDGDGMFTDAAFSVRVTTADLAVVQAGGSELQLLDTDTNAFVPVVASSPTPSLAATLDRGQLAYHVNAGGGNQLWVFDLFARRNTHLAPEAANATLRAMTSDSRLVFTTGSGVGSDLWFHDPLTNLSLAIAATPGEADEHPMVNAADLVFYERGSAGQADVFYYDPATRLSSAVATSVRDERLLGVLPNGGVVLSRVGDGGELDLFCFRLGTGLVEIGADQASLGTMHKTFHAAGAASEVVFTASSGGGDELWFWSPATGQSVQIATGVDFEFLAVVGSIAVYAVDVSGSERDLFFRDMAGGVSGTVRDAGDVSALLAVTAAGGTAWAVANGSAAPGSLTAVSLTASPVSVAHAAGGAVGTGSVFGNGDVVLVRTNGAGISRFDVSGQSWSTIAGTDLAFAGAGAAAGDFLYTATVSAQTDLFLWDDLAASSVTVSGLVGDDVFQAVTADGKVLFTHVYAPDTNEDLAVWDPAGPSITRLTDGTGILGPLDHVVLGVYSAVH